MQGIDIFKASLKSTEYIGFLKCSATIIINNFCCYKDRNGQKIRIRKKIRKTI